MRDTRLPKTAEPAAARASDFAGWVAPWITDMHRLASRLAPGSTDDVVQDALIRAWRRWSTYDPSRGAPRTWLLALVAGEARRARLHGRRRFFDVEPPRERGDVDRDVDVQRAVNALPRRMRLAVELHYFVGLSVTETAQTMGVAEGTAKSTLHDARERLRPLLQVEPASGRN